MTSNVGQSYPYSSETEAERAARIAALVEGREGLADKLPDDPLVHQAMLAYASDFSLMRVAISSMSSSTRGRTMAGFVGLGCACTGGNPAAAQQARRSTIRKVMTESLNF